MLKQLYNFLEVRLGIKDLVEQNLTGYLLPRNVNIWYTLGAVLMALLAVARIL